MRRDYTRDGLTEAQAPAEPFALFHQWFADAWVKTEQAPVEANAMTVAGGCGRKVRIAAFCCSRGLTQGFTFFTNYESAKGQHLAANCSRP